MMLLRIYFMVFVLFVYSCHSKSRITQVTTKAPKEDVLLIGNWKIVQVGEQIIGTEASLHFSAQNWVNCNTGCNEMGATFSETNGQIKIGTVLSTKKYCEGNMEWESQLSKLLPTIKSYEVSGEKMILFGKQKIHLVKP